MDCAAGFAGPLPMVGAAASPQLNKSDLGSSCSCRLGVVLPTGARDPPAADNSPDHSYPDCDATVPVWARHAVANSSRSFSVS
jgi:hypothetical protein